MNAAARAIHQANIFNGQLSDMKLSKQWGIILFLAGAVLASAMSVVYVTNAHRMLFSQYEQARQQSNQLELQWGQLLLEQASLATPSRVQQLAERQLDMVLPEEKQIMLIETPH